MKKEKNIIITSINPYLRMDNLNFFFYEDQYGESKYCTAFSSQEAGVKQVLSSNKIDDIVVIGPSECCDPDKSMVTKTLRNEYSFYSADFDNSSVYDMFAYNLAEFLNNINIELYNILENNDQEQNNLIDASIKEISNYIKERFGENDKGRLFHYLRMGEVYGDMPVVSSAPRKYVDNVLCKIYANLNDYYKMHSLMCNDDLSITYVPFNRDEENSSSLQNFVAYLENSFKDNNTEFNVFLDTQGLSQADSLSLFYTVIMFSSQRNNVCLKTFMTANPNYGFYVHKIYDSMRTVALNDLSSGINDFINYGKVDLLEKYWGDSKYANEYIKSFIGAMRKIDIGISLCNFYELEKGINSLKHFIKQGYKVNDDDFESGLFELLRYGIISDYGDILLDDSDTVDVFELVKWAYKKKYYQQAITFIEAQIPGDIIKRGIWYYCRSENESDAVLDTLAKGFNEVESYMHYQFNNIEHYVIKTEGRSKLSRSSKPEEKNFEYVKYKMSQLKENNESGYQAYSVVDDLDVVEEALLAYYIVSFKRNSINHAERNFSISAHMEREGESAIWNEIETAIDYFINSYQKAVDLAKGKQFDIHYLTRADVQERAYKLKKSSDYHKTNKDRKPCRFCILDPNGKRFSYNHLDEWLTRFADKHPELMEEPQDVVIAALIKTRDEFMQNQTISSYRGYRLLPTVFDK